MKYIRVNFHFMNSTDGKYNMPKEEVTKYAYEWINIANGKLAGNLKMLFRTEMKHLYWKFHIRYMISPDPSIPGDSGVYYHVNDTLCYAVKTGQGAKHQ